MGEMTLGQALEEYKSIYMAARNFSERTRVEYGHDVEELASFLEQLGVNRVGELSLPRLDRYLAELDYRGIAGSTRKRKVVSIRSFLAFLYHNNYISVNLAQRIIPPRADFKNPRFLTKREYNNLLDACSHSLRDFAIIQLLLQTGIKLSELTRLRVTDVEFPAKLFPEMKGVGYLHIYGSERKKNRVVSLNYKACQALDKYIKQKPLTISSALFINRFGKRLSPRGVEKVLRKYFEQVGIENATVQSLRHTFGTYHAAKGTSLKTLQTTMGLKDSRSTSLYFSLADQVASREMQENSL